MHWISHTNNAALFLSLNLTKLEDKFQIWEPEIVSENVLSQVSVTLGMLGKYIYFSWSPVHCHSNREQTNSSYFFSKAKKEKKKKQKKPKKSYSECDWENYHFYCFLHFKMGRWNPMSWPFSTLLPGMCSVTTQQKDLSLVFPFH